MTLVCYLNNKRDFTDLIKAKDLEMGRVFGPSIITWSLKAEKLPWLQSERNVTTEGGSETLLVLKAGEGATSQGMWAASRRQKRQGNRFSSRTSRKECRPADNLIRASGTHVRVLTVELEVKCATLSHIVAT